MGYYSWVLVTGGWKIMCWYRFLLVAVLLVIFGLSLRRKLLSIIFRQGHALGFYIPLWLRLRGQWRKFLGGFWWGIIFRCGELFFCHAENCVVFCCSWLCDRLVITVEIGMINPWRFFVLFQGILGQGGFGWGGFIFLFFARFWYLCCCTGLLVCYVYVLVFIVGFSGCWIGSKPGGDLGVTLGIGLGYGNTLVNSDGVLLVVGDVA